VSAPTVTEETPVPVPSRDRSPSAAPSSRLHAAKRRAALAFVAPGLILFLLFVAYPVLATVQSSFYSIRPAGLTTERVWVGLQWFRQALFEDQTFRIGVRNSLLWAGWSMVVDISLAFVLAFILHSRVRGWRFFRTAWFVPLLLSPVLVGLVWRSILRLDGGLVNASLTALGLESLAQDWLGQPSALVWLFMMTTWSSVGFYMVLILAGLEDLPEELIDAARVDGASRWQQIRHIILPLLRPVLITLTILTFVFKMRVFDLVWVTTQGGPYKSTETVVTWIVKRAFYWQGAFDLGYPAAMSTIWMAAMAVGVFVLRRVLGGRRSLEDL
jgi:multiple sugar transport system permease protein/raffinose/stachyose/melibiose transport system permease protein